MFQGAFKSFSKKFQDCVMKISKVFKKDLKWLKEASRLYRGNFKGVSRVFQD